MLYLGNG